MAYTGTARGYVADQVKADQARWIVHPYPMTPDNVTKDRPVVSVWRGDLVPGSSAFNLRHNLTIHLYGAKTAKGAAETELDGLLDELMLSLQRLALFTWTNAERAQFANNTISGWIVTGHIETPNIYKSAITEEKSTP